MSDSFRRNLKNTLTIVLLASVLFTIVFYLLSHFFVYLFLIKSPDYISSGVGAFMGAFAAFIFLIIERTFSKYRERRVKHFNALVRAEYILNENLQLISDNIYMIDGFVQVLKKGVLHTGSFNPLIWDREILLDLANLEIINRLSSYATNLRKTNRDLDMAEQWYEQLKLALIQQNIDKETYDTNISILIGQFRFIKKFLFKIDKENQIRQSEVRVMMKNRNVVDWFFDKISTHRLPKVFDKKVKKEQAALKKEREETKAQSKKEIEKMKS